MDMGERLSAAQYRTQAARWRQLAGEATTPLAKSHLLKLAQQCEFLAAGGLGVIGSPAADADGKVRLSGMFE
jgi:hypothetical protein